jgi:hypothetical protein
MNRFSFLLKVEHYQNLYPLSFLPPDAVAALVNYYSYAPESNVRKTLDLARQVEWIRADLAEGLGLEIGLRLANPGQREATPSFDLTLACFSLKISAEPYEQMIKRLHTDPSPALNFTIELVGYKGMWYEHPMLSSMLVELGTQSPHHAVVADTLAMKAGFVAAEVPLRRMNQFTLADEIRSYAMKHAHRGALLC